jgi:hypothetical protein
MTILDTTTVAGIQYGELVHVREQRDRRRYRQVLRRGGCSSQNINNIAFNNNVIQGGGSITALASVTGCNVSSCSGNWMQSLAGPLFDFDVTSRANVGYNNKNESNTSPGVHSSGIWHYDVTYTTSMPIPGQVFGGNRVGVYRITPNNSTAFTITCPANGIPDASMVPGQVFTIVIRNTTGGALGAVTFAAASFKTAATAFTQPAERIQQELHVLLRRNPRHRDQPRWRCRCRQLTRRR